MNYSFNLKRRKARRKDYSSKTHKLGVGIPDEFSFVTRILEQDAENCTAFASVAIRESEIPGSSFDPRVFWNDELSFANDKVSSGYDLEVPAAVAIKTGFCPTGNPSVRQNKPSAYFWVHGSDMFNAMISAMWVNQRPLSAGMDWYNDYPAVIEKPGKDLLGGHNIKIAGKKMINGKPYLILQNSWGEGQGDKGLFYVSREMANKIFNLYGVFYWSDSDDTSIKTLGFINALWVNIKALLRR